MGLFEKKFCDICGEKIGLLGNRKLEDANMCSKCAKRISPFLTDRRRTTLAEMKEHLAYRDENLQKLNSFNPSLIFGEDKKVYIDTNSGSFVISNYDPNGFRTENPDIIPLSTVNYCNSEIKENREEIYTHDENGNRQSYNPPRYNYTYDFEITIGVNNRWFSEITFNLNKSDVEGIGTVRYHDFEIMVQQLKNALMNSSTQNTQPTQTNTVPAQNAAPATDNTEWICTGCGTHNTTKFCTNCGNPATPARKKACGNCGWMADDAASAPKFCPNCGTQMNQ